MTKMSAHEFMQDGILSVAVHPRWVKSSMGAAAGEDFQTLGLETSLLMKILSIRNFIPSYQGSCY